MNKLMMCILVLASFSAHAGGFLDLDFRGDSSSFSLDFREGFVCKVEPSFSKEPTLGYGATDRLARINATQNCMAENDMSQMFCDDDITCESLSLGSDNTSVSISIENGQVGVRFSSGANVSCVAKGGFGEGLFVAEAPTETEASVYAQKLCMGQTGNARMHCDLEGTCQNLTKSGVSTKIKTKNVEIDVEDVRNVFKGIFGK